MANLRSILSLGPVMPVIVIDDANDAVPLANALLEGGINTIEVTLRTSAALKAMSEIAQSCTDMVIGAGTVLDGEHARQAIDAGAVFAVSPGATQSLIDECQDVGLDLLPGASTASEAMSLYAQGFDTLKFFPACASRWRPIFKISCQPVAANHLLSYWWHNTTNS